METVLNGVEENTYVYKPYGGTLAKTGSATDPSFLWNGGSGYRSTGQSYSESYVRRRHLAITSGLWTSLDPWWPRETACRYGNSSPVNFRDPSGLTTSCTIKKFKVREHKPECAVKLDSDGFLMFKVRKPVTYHCEGANQGIGPRTPGFLTQLVNFTFTLNSGDGLPNSIVDSSYGTIQDGRIQCNKEPGWVLEGVDAPGWWLDSGTIGCTLATPDFRGSNVIADTGMHYLSYQGQFNSFCVCDADLGVQRSERDWSFNWGLFFTGTGKDFKYWFDGECIQ